MEKADFIFYIFANGMGFGLSTRPLGLHTMTGQRLQVDYFNIFFSPKASPLDTVWSRKVTLLLSPWA